MRTGTSNSGATDGCLSDQLARLLPRGKGTSLKPLPLFAKESKTVPLAATVVVANRHRRRDCIRRGDGL